MKNICTLLLVLLVAISSNGQVGNTKFENGNSIVFLGNSITHRCQYSQYIENFYFTRYPEQRLKLHTAGVSGDKAADALLRFGKEVARYNPDFVPILLGMNDASYLPFDRVIFDRYKKDMSSLLDSIKKVGATPILMTPTMFDSKQGIQKPWFKDKPEMCEEYNGVLALYGSWLQEVAYQKNYPFVDLRYALNDFTYEKRKSDPQFTIISDGVHPDALGMVLMACSFLNQTHGADTVSSVIINICNETIDFKISKNGTLKNVHYSNDKLSFHFQAEALPWVLPGNLQEQISSYSVFNKLNKEILTVGGLELGKYYLQIENDTIGVFSNMELLQGIELQNNGKTPQYRQAQKIASLNASRNGGLYALRDLWTAKKNLRYAKMEFELKPNDPKLVEKIEGLKKQLMDFDEKEEDILAKALKIQQEIYQLSQPEKLHYQLIKTK